MQSTTPSIALSDLDLLPVEGGEFWMGDDNGAYEDEKPVHRVRVSGLWMGRTPVVQQLWQNAVGSNPSQFKGDRRPVDSVSWDDAQEFLRRLNALGSVRELVRQLDPPGTEFRLPTEAEWEHAAKGGQLSQGYEFSGSDRLEQVGWFDGNSNGQTHEVGQLLDNELGLRDLSGNVWEWCSDWYSRLYYAEQNRQVLAVDPQGPADGRSRVLRGGGWISYRSYCRAACRTDDPPGGPELRRRPPAGPALQSARGQLAGPVSRAGREQRQRGEGQAESLPLRNRQKMLSMGMGGGM